MDYSEAVNYLYSLGHETLAMKLGLASTKKLLSALADPHFNYKRVQIAGTNGKGSTASFLDSICLAAGIKTGLFTSPHLIEITERIKINSQDISREEFAQAATRVRDAAERLVTLGELPALPTFFEQVTVLALLAFSSQGLELAILETGLGGRLDSTTAADSRIAVITPIDYDHQEYLGESIEEIASEKAAIIHEQSIAIIAPQSESAIEVLSRRCREMRVVPVTVSDSDWTLKSASPDGRSIIDINHRRCKISDVTLGLRGRHQIVNALTAVAASISLRQEGFEISDDAIKKGLESASHAGRLEWFSRPFKVLLDGAHNPHGARALAAYLREFCSGPITLIFGAMRDKDLRETLLPLLEVTRTLILTEIDNARTAEIEQLRLAVDERFNGEVYSTHTVCESLDLASGFSEINSVTCIAGSLYLVGEARNILDGFRG